MKMCIQIQLNPRNKKILKVIHALLGSADVKAIAIDKGAIKHEPVNISITVRSVKRTWSALAPMIRKDESIGRRTIIVSEGKHGWNDYGLIHHWKAGEIDKKWK